MNNQQLANFILDPATGLTSASKIFQKLGKKVPLKQIKEVINNLETYQINQSARLQPKQYNSITAGYPGDILQIDLMDISNTSTVNKNFKYILTCVDIYSRYALAVPIKNKEASTVLKAMSKIIKEFRCSSTPVGTEQVPCLHPRNIHNITSDDGSEFNNSKFKQLMTENNINHYITPANTPHKLAIVERFHRTLRNRIRLYEDHNKTNKFIDHLPDFIKNYNNTVHTTTKQTPQAILDGALSKQVIKKVIYDLQLGDPVRITTKKGPFDKGLVRFSNEIYTISEIHPNSFSIKNHQNQQLKRRYQGYELKKVNPDSIITSNKEDARPAVKKTATKRRLQKRDPAFNDKNTHKVDDYGNVKITRRHLQPASTKRQTKRPVRIDI